MAAVSCADDLNISPIDPQTSPSYKVEELLAKQYGTLGLTGQKGPDGNGDMSGDEGESGFYRTVFNLNELNSDEVLWAWQDNPDIMPITNMAWTSASQRVNWCYQRLAYDITLHNQFISEQTGKLPDDEVAEVRFLRCLNYYHSSTSSTRLRSRWSLTATCLPRRAASTSTSGSMRSSRPSSR